MISGKCSMFMIQQKSILGEAKTKDKNYDKLQY